MTTTAPSVPEEVALQPDDPELPLLASQAAIELDNLLLGRESKLEGVTRLGQLLEKSFSRKGLGDEGHATPDSLAVAVVRDALHGIQGWGKLVTLSDLVTRASDIADGLQKAGTSTTGGEVADRLRIERMRDFCASLSTCAAAYIQSIYDLSRVPHPYRR